MRRTLAMKRGLWSILQTNVLSVKTSRTWIIYILALVPYLLPSSAMANSGLEDKIADVLVWVVIVVVPLAGVALVWTVHVWPERVAEKRGHLQKDAIKALCFLSLVFGGLLWPFAMLWAYMKPPRIVVAKRDGDRAEPDGSDVPNRVDEIAALHVQLAAMKQRLDALHVADAKGRPGLT